MEIKEILVKAIQHVDVVISTVGLSQLLNQTNIISAIKEPGKHIKVSLLSSRFIPIKIQCLWNFYLIKMFNYDL